MNIKSKLLVLFSQYNLILDSLKLMLLSKRNKKQKTITLLENLFSKLD